MCVHNHASLGEQSVAIVFVCSKLMLFLKRPGHSTIHCNKNLPIRLYVHLMHVLYIHTHLKARTLVLGLPSRDVSSFKRDAIIFSFAPPLAAR